MLFQELWLKYLGGISIWQHMKSKLLLCSWLIWKMNYKAGCIFVFYAYCLLLILDWFYFTPTPSGIHKFIFLKQYWKVSILDLISSLKKHYTHTKLNEMEIHTIFSMNYFHSKIKNKHCTPVSRKWLLHFLKYTQPGQKNKI